MKIIYLLNTDRLERELQVTPSIPVVGIPVNLNCQHDNAVFWTFNGGNLPDNILVLPDFSLQINIVEAHHVGTYNCTGVYSRYVQFQSSIDLVLYGKYYDFLMLL